MDEIRPVTDQLPQPYEPGFFERETLCVARDLLGGRLLRRHPETGAWSLWRIVETEAYTAEDPACHAYNRKTGRAQTLYALPGTAYVYLIYGMYDCLNVVTEPEGTAGAVLFRALEPLGLLCAERQEKCPEVRGRHVLQAGNPGKKPDHAPNTRGPGRLTRALNITVKANNGLPMTESASGLYLAKGDSVPDAAIVQTTRIGITKAADYPWRFYLAANPWVSVR